MVIVGGGGACCCMLLDERERTNLEDDGEVRMAAEPRDVPLKGRGGVLTV